MKCSKVVKICSASISWQLETGVIKNFGHPFRKPKFTSCNVSDQEVAKQDNLNPMRNLGSYGATEIRMDDIH